MHVNFTSRTGGPERLICEAELVFDDDGGPLANLKLVGFSLWHGADGEIYVTFPSRAFGAGTDRRYFDYLRPAESSEDPRGVTKAFKEYVVAQYRQSAAGVAGVAAPAAGVVAAEAGTRRRRAG